MAPYLTPILSTDSSSSSTTGTPATTTAIADSVENQESRRLILARSQCRTPSTSSQVSELDVADENENDNDDDDDDIDNHRRRHHHKMRAATSCHGGVCRGTRGGGSVSSSVSGGSSLAQQYLFHTTQNTTATSNHLHHHHQNNKRFKQILQSIPLPLVATSIITVFILCLLLNECKSLQVAQKSAVQSLVMEPLLQEQQLDDVGGGDGGSGLGTGSDGPIKLLRRQQPMMVVAATRAMGGSEMSADSAMDSASGASSAGSTNEEEPISDNTSKQQQQLPETLFAAALKREITGDLLQQRHHLSTQYQSKRHSSSSASNTPEHQRSLRADSVDQKQQQVDGSPGYDNLGSMLLGMGVSSAGSGDTPSASDEGGQQEQVDQRYIDGEPSTGGGGVVGTTNIELAGSRPANLRSSALELDLSEQRHSHAAQNQRHRYLQHQQQQQQKQQAYKTNEDHVKHFQHLSNNHDRPFDVAQIQCNNTEEGFERFACPTPDLYGRYRCIEDRLFCDGYFDCPGGEDEERVSCMYYKLTKHAWI